MAECRVIFVLAFTRETLRGSGSVGPHWMWKNCVKIQEISSWQVSLVMRHFHMKEKGILSSRYMRWCSLCSNASLQTDRISCTFLLLCGLEMHTGLCLGSGRGQSKGRQDSVMAR